MITQMTAWDTEQDAVEFFRAYLKRTTRKYQNAVNTAPEDTADILQVLSTGEGTVSIERRGKQVLVVEGLPDRTRLQNVSKKLWEARLTEVSEPFKGAKVEG